MSAQRQNCEVRRDSSDTARLSMARNCESASIVNMEAEESTVLGTVTKQGLLNTQQVEKV
jgi:hypothetical protein